MTDRNHHSKEIVIHLPEDLAGDLERAAEEGGRTRSELVQAALTQYLHPPRPIAGEEVNAIYLSAPVNAMLKGFYEENTTLGEVKKHGDFGLGTFNNLDGEMVMLDGIIYRLRADGRTYSVADEVQTPFACVTFWRPTVTEEFEGELDYVAFNALLGRLLPSDNMFYALRVEGFFKEVQVWSVSRQENYQPLN